jgi:hypothetical protein
VRDLNWRHKIWVIAKIIFSIVLCTNLVPHWKGGSVLIFEVWVNVHFGGTIFSCLV